MLLLLFSPVGDTSADSSRLLEREGGDNEAVDDESDVKEREKDEDANVENELLVDVDVSEVDDGDNPFVDVDDGEEDNTASLLVLLCNSWL